MEKDIFLIYKGSCWDEFDKLLDIKGSLKEAIPLALRYLESEKRPFGFGECVPNQECTFRFWYEGYEGWTEDYDYFKMVRKTIDFQEENEIKQ